MIATEIIVLAKQPYRESALLLGGISPDCGRLSLMAHRAQSISAENAPVADLFRALEVEFEERGSGDLHTVKRMELIEDFGVLAERPKHFMLAGRIGSFLLKNAAPDLPLPFTYDAFKSVLFQLCRPEDAPNRWSMVQCAVVVRVTYLYENGLLPEARSATQNRFLEMLVAAGVENSALPECHEQYWETFNHYLAGLCEYHDLQK